MPVRPAVRALIVGLAAVALGACGNEPTGSSFRFQSVVISPSGAFPGGRGASVSFTAGMINNLGEPITNDSFVWTFSSSNPAVIEISPTGKATAKSVGKATITARAGSFEGQTEVTVSQIPSGLNPVSGDKQSGVVGKALVNAVAVKVVDAGGQPMSGQVVRFAVTSGGGKLSADSVVSGPDGVAQTTWTLGTSTTIPQSITATSNGIVSVLTATALADQPATMTVVGGAGQAGFALEPLDSLVTVQVNDQFGNVVPGKSVTWTVTGGGGSVSAATVTTDASGRASTRWTLGSTSGQQTLQAQVAPLAATAFTATAQANVILTGTVSAQSGYLAPGRSIARALRAGGGRLGSLASAIPSDPYYPLQAWNYEMIGLDQAWKITTGSTAVTVAVVDDGTRPDHPSLTPQLTSDGYDFVRKDSVLSCIASYISVSGDGNGPDADPTTPMAYDVSSGCANGTATVAGRGVEEAGIIGAAAGTSTGVGVDRAVKIRAVRVIGTTGLVSDSALARGILYAAGLPADTGATGSVTAPSRAPIILVGVAIQGSPSAVLTAAVQAAAAAGSLIIAPAGDNGSGSPAYPAAFPEVLSVAAVSPARTLEAYSNYGATVGIAAPGGDGSSDPSRDVEVPAWNFSTNAATWTSAHGTALAAAHVAGVAALLLAQDPTLTAAQLRARLTTYASALGDSNVPNAGVLNAFASLEQGGDFHHDLYVRAIDANTGAIAGTVKANADGTYRLAHLAPGTSYEVYAGQDEEGNATIGTPGRVWGALGGSATPTTVDTPSTQVYAVPAFAVALPSETGLNTTQGSADPIALGGWMDAQLSLGQAKWYKVTLPAGTYTFGTSGKVGACGLAQQVNTTVAVYDASGAVVGSNDDGTGYDYCGKVVATVAAGTYRIGVQASGSIGFRGVAQQAGTFRVYVR